jgi:hypothetical protein
VKGEFNGSVYQTSSITSQPTTTHVGATPQSTSAIHTCEGGGPWGKGRGRGALGEGEGDPGGGGTRKYSDGESAKSAGSSVLGG